ncbi:hypothetical protein E4U53_007512 [Claviceps sorghi]|nr:hypothetical protein E4U53_007512 [Claviceps sorghi]
MPVDAWLNTTSKLSVLHRKVIYRNQSRRYRRLRRLQIWALQHATPRVVLFTAILTCLPEPSETEEEELLDDVKRSDFPWLAEGRSAGASDESDEGQGGVDEYGTDDGEEEGEEDGGDGDAEMQVDGLVPLFRCCTTRQAMVVILNIQQSRFEADPLVEALSPWQNTFSGTLELFLHHLDTHCCPRGAAQAPRDDNPERHRLCVSNTYMDRLQEEINKTLGILIDVNSKMEDILEKPSDGWSRWTNLRAPKSKARFMKSGGLGSPLVESCTPDEMAEYDSGLDDTTMYDAWEEWVWSPWEEPPWSAATARPERRVLVHDDTSACSKEGGEGEVVNEECDIEW